MTADIESLPSLLDVQAVAKMLDCSTRHVFRLVDCGKMPAPVHVGALLRWPRSAIARWIADGCPSVEGGQR